MKTCKECQQTKELVEFYTDSSKLGHRYICKACDKARIARIQLRTKEQYVTYWETTRNHRGCLYCDYRFYVGALDFHHRDPSLKIFSVNASSRKRSWEETIAEIDKCDLVCNRCHREVHAGFR